MKKKSLLIVTTYEDLSLPLFFNYQVTRKFKIKILLFHETLQDFKDSLKNNSFFDLTYIRDPFNGVEVKNIQEKLNFLINEVQSKKQIDNITRTEDVFIEDKWKQYEIFNNFMPKTSIFSKKTAYNENKQIIKKRISSRGRGIIFDLKLIKKPSEYLIQEKLNIKNEYRILAIKGKTVKTIVGKQFTFDQQLNKVRVKIQSAEKINTDTLEFVESLNKKHQLDFVGYDLAELQDGSYKLIEINRSPQFIAFYRKTGINLAEKLFD